MISDISNILIVKYLRNDLDDAESKAVLDWLQEKEENKEFLFGLKEAYMLSRWRELQPKANVETEWDDLSSKLEEFESPKRNKFLVNLLRYAAVAVIVFFVGYFFRDLSHRGTISYNVVQTVSGEHSTLLLSDGTKVFLNENSTFKYPGSFGKESRNVILKGEAYFEAAHNSKKPFMVNVGTYTVKVLGTKFDVDAYPNQIYVYTSLKEGRVQILDNSEKSNIISELNPGSQLSYNRQSGEYFVKSVDPEGIGDWRNGQMIFRRERLSEIARRLEHKYGYAIYIQNNVIGNLKYNITVENEPLEEILSDIHLITPQVSYSIHKDRKVVILK